jgi:hypothetical protein
MPNGLSVKGFGGDESTAGELDCRFLSAVSS